KITGKVSRQTVQFIRELNLLLSSRNPEIGSFLKQKCIEENKWHETLDLLVSAAAVDTCIEAIPTRVDWSQIVTKEKRLKFQEKIKAKYEPLKYKDKTASKKLLKEVSIGIEELSHPKIVNTKTESYVDDVSKVAEGFNALAAKYPKQIFQIEIDTGKVADNYHSAPEDDLKEFFNG